MGKKRAPAFLRKLYEILNDKSIEDIIWIIENNVLLKNLNKGVKQVYVPIFQ